MVNSVNNANGNKDSISNNNGYTVKSGDTLSAIAQKQGVNVDALMKANPQIKDPNLINPGQELRMPGQGQARPTGNLSGIMVSPGADPSERPTRMTGTLSMDGITANSSLPSPYRSYQNEIMAASNKYNIPPEVIAGVISRETNGRNIIGDGGHGHGLMQIDDRYHGQFLRNNQNGLDPASNIDYGTSILRDNLNRYNGDMRKALAAYNAGPGNVDKAVSRGLSPDAYTTGNNYGSDVLSRAGEFKQYFSNSSNNGTSSNRSENGNDGQRNIHLPGNNPGPSSASGNSGPSSNSGSDIDSIDPRGNSGRGNSNDRAAAPDGNHTVVSGDTLWDISQKYGVNLQDVIKANPQIANPDLIFPGQQVRIPGGGNAGGGSNGSSGSGGPESTGAASMGSTSAPNIEPGQFDGSRPAPGTTRTDAWNPINPPLTNGPGDRSASNYAQVLNQLAVANNPRYAPRDGNTYCNIYVWDATKAMGAEIPHWVNGRELDANGTVDWMHNQGANQGWRKVSAAEAQAMANQGMPSVALWKNQGGIGHVAMVRPGEMANGPAIAQAGARNFNNGHVGDSFGSRPVEYWVHN